jgi:hypothetical protein
MTIDQFLTKDEVEQARKLFNAAGGHGATSVIESQIIKPNIARINKALGQENDSRYLAYCVEYVMSQLAKVPS